VEPQESALVVSGSRSVPLPSQLQPGVRWRTIEPSAGYACGIDTLGRRHCWGLRKLSPL
jgi:hypothetical protein